MMKYLKMLGLAAVAAAALMAFAGTAAADELCTEPAVSNMCPAGKGITEIHGSLVANAQGQVTAILETTGGTVLDTCTAATVKINEIMQGTSPPGQTTEVTGNVSVLNWGALNTPCTFTTSTVRPGTMDATLNAAGETTLTSTGAEVTVNTGLFGSCVFTTGDIGSVPQGGDKLTINAVVTRISGLCPETERWTATYTITNHNAVYLINN